MPRSMTKAGYVPPAPEKPKPSKKKPRRKKRKGSGTAFLVLLVLVAAVVLGLGVYRVWQETEAYRDTFFPGTFLGTRSLDGMTADEALALLREYSPSSWEFTLAWNGEETVLTAEDVQLTVDEDATLTPLWQIGRNENMLAKWRRIRDPGEPVVTEPVIRYDADALEEFLDAYRETLDKEPVSAGVVYRPEKSTPFTFTDEEVGWHLDVEPVRTAILASLETLESGHMDVFPEEVAPAYWRSELENAVHLRAWTEETAARSPELQNAARAAENFQGIVLWPGETLSFNDVVGRRTEARGYVTAPEPAYGTGVEGPGGGVCRTATLLYRVALEAGLGAERHAAVYPVDYADPGMEAAVSDQGLDLVIANTLDMPVYFSARTWEADGNVTIRLECIGAFPSEGYDIQDEIVTGAVPAAPVYRRDRDGTIAWYEDERVLVSEAKPAVTATVTRIVTDTEGVEIRRDELGTDEYAAIPETYYVGSHPRE